MKPYLSFESVSKLESFKTANVTLIDCFVLCLVTFEQRRTKQSTKSKSINQNQVSDRVIRGDNPYIEEYAVCVDLLTKQSLFFFSKTTNNKRTKKQF